MNTATYTADPLTTAGAACPTKAGHKHAHSICWGAIFAGAAAAASLSLILLILGVGLGLSSVSPWASEGISAESFGWGTVGWLTLTQLAASGLGGYMAGRLRVRWQGVHADEVHFRDTAHGFLAWSIATLVTAGLLSSAVGSIVSGGAKTAGGAAAMATVATAAPAAGAAASAANAGTGYFTDALFRKDMSAAAAAPTASAPAAATPKNMPNSMPASTTGSDDGNAMPRNAEAGRILANALSTGTLPPEDTTYLGQMVAQRTGLSQADAEKRVTDTFNRAKAKAVAAKEDAKQAADKARKASAMASMWVFVSLLFGAFIASFLALAGGRHRDQF
jgi:hypothetical protein